MAIRYRPATDDDIDAIHAVVRAAETFDRMPLATPRDEIVEDFAAPDLDRSLDTLVAVDEGEIVAYSLVYPLPTATGKQRTFGFGSVHPDHRGGGIGTHLVEWQTRRGTEILSATDTGEERVLRTFLWEWQAEARELYERHGYHLARWFHTMVRPLYQPIPEAAVPDGLAIVGWSEDWSEETRLTHNAAFRDHWGSTDNSPQFWAHRLASSGNRSDLHRLIVDGDTVVGYALNAHFPDDETVTGRREGWIELLGTHPDYRGRGVASALINESLRLFAAEDLTHGALGVDSESETGAHTLYGRLGFETLYRSTAYLRRYENSP
ncbi:MAG: GNAT family N-acetyltransferase [Acidimicrobiia bacterium]|nr:GNAT family N-acetyltransferase [Acidimicrobiia bacterium]